MSAIRAKLNGAEALEANRERLMSHLRRRGIPFEDAEDLLQDLSEIVLRRVLPEHPDAATQWLFTCLRWLLARRHRRAGARPAPYEGLVGEAAVLDEVPDTGDDPGQAVVHQIVCDQVLDAMGDLRQADRELLLAVADGTPAAALARAQGCSRQAVNERLHRARRLLVAALPYDVFGS